jgi:hypothetical protein
VSSILWLSLRVLLQPFAADDSIRPLRRRQSAPLLREVHVDYPVHSLELPTASGAAGHWNQCLAKVSLRAAAIRKTDAAAGAGKAGAASTGAEKVTATDRRE